MFLVNSFLKGGGGGGGGGGLGGGLGNVLGGLISGAGGGGGGGGGGVQRGRGITRRWQGAPGGGSATLVTAKGPGVSPSGCKASLLEPPPREAPRNSQRRLARWAAA